jgi:hypothetical protein
MNYIRLCKGVTDKGRLIPVTENIYNGVDLNTDYYTSAFLYNDKQYEIFKNTGTIKGIDNTITKKLYWDFDSEKDVSAAKDDANTLCERLINKYGFKPESEEEIRKKIITIVKTL